MSAYSDEEVLKRLNKPRTFNALLNLFGWSNVIRDLHDALCRLKRDGFVIEVCELDGRWYYERTKAGERHLKRIASKKKKGKKGA